MASLKSLPNEILTMIVDLLFDTSRDTIGSLVLVNKFFYTMIMHQTYTFRSENFRGDLERINQRNTWGLIRRVKITEHLASRLMFQTFILAKMTHLTDIDLEYVKHHMQHGDTRDMVAYIAAVVRTCPNLHHLKLDLQPQPKNYLSQLFSSPTLENVRHPSGDHGLNAELLAERKEGYWVVGFDHSHLKKLTVPDGSVLPHVAKFTSLKEVDFTDCEDLSFFPEFLRLVPAVLETIKIHKLDAPELNAVLKHGSRLRTLHIGCQQWSKPWLVHTGVLQQIQEECPRIQELALYWPKDMAWRCDVLSIIAGFRRLRSLKLVYAQLLHDGPYNNIPSRITFLNIAELFMSIRNHASGKMSSFRKLCVVPVSDGDKKHVSFNMPSLICELSEREDEAARGIFAVSCPDIAKEEQSVMQTALEAGVDPISLLERSKEGFRLKRVSRDFRLAWYGPAESDSVHDYRFVEYEDRGLKFFWSSFIDEHANHNELVVENDEDYLQLPI
ncbi:hypothetical protein F5Y05DRAFT_419537 [Hypoxylon sp. FL0543]|nr:hypothetical protein F5Y05DRAFT_419537 [Hypoxylon sp. FL0543]